jgi:adenylate cyclase
MSLMAELQRRKVFKVAAGYAVVGWLVIQVATSVLPLYDTPAWFLRAFVLIVSLGFPIALVMAWMLEVTPEGIKMTS